METIRDIRDIVIIVAAFFDLVLLAILIAIAFLVWKMLSTVRAQLPPVFGTVKKTATTVEGTADFIMTTVAMPLIRSVAFVFAVTRFFQVLLSRGNSATESRS